MYQEPKAYVEWDEAPRVSLPLFTLANGVAKHSLLETAEEQPHFLYLNKFKTQCKSKRKREWSGKKSSKMQGIMLFTMGTYSTPTNFFCCKNDALHLKLGDRCSCPGKCNEGWGQGPSSTQKAQGSDTKRGLAGEDWHKPWAKQLSCPFPQMQENWLSRQELSYLLNYYSVF